MSRQGQKTMMPESRHFQNALVCPLQMRVADALKVLIGVAVFLVFVALPAMVAAQEKGEMPWFDGEREAVVPFGVKLREDESNPDRHNIEPYKKTDNSSSTSNQNTGTTTGGAATAAGANFGSAMSILVWTLSILVGVALLALFIFMIYKSRFAPEEEEELPRRTMEESIRQLPFELEVDHKGDFRSLAYQLYQQGDLRKAIILLFSHVLVSLDQKGFVRLKKGKTNRQYLGELKPYSNLGGYFSQVMVRFEEAFFGDHEIDKPAFEACWNGLEKFQSGLETTRVNTEVTL